MTRLIERGEFEKRLADYSVQVLKAFSHLQERIAALEAPVTPTAPDVTTERVEP